LVEPFPVMAIATTMRTSIGGRHELLALRFAPVVAT
jgi:hypothetical protein